MKCKAVFVDLEARVQSNILLHVGVLSTQMSLIIVKRDA